MIQRDMISDYGGGSPAPAKKEVGLRHNSGKLRYDLLEPFAQEQLAKVFTSGANKYADRIMIKNRSY